MKTGNVVLAPRHWWTSRYRKCRFLEVYPQTPEEISFVSMFSVKTHAEIANPPRVTQSPILIELEEALGRGLVAHSEK